MLLKALPIQSQHTNMAKKLLTGNITAFAKMPIRKMTLDHLQQAYTEFSQAICRSIGTDDAGGTPGTVAYDILYGLQSTTVGSAFTANRGAIYIGGEIFFVPAASFTISVGEFPILVTTTTYATGDPTEFTDGNTYNIHQIRTATIVSGTVLTPNYLGTFSDFTNKNLPLQVSSGSGITNGTNITSGTIFAKKDRLGVVIMHGFLVMNGSYALNQTLCTLPATHRPTANINCGVMANGGGGINGVYITIEGSTGIVKISGDPNSRIANNTIVYLDNIVFYNV